MRKRSAAAESVGGLVAERSRLQNRRVSRSAVKSPIDVGNRVGSRNLSDRYPNPLPLE